MSTLTDYTSYDDIRAALGVSADELEDATLALDTYLFGLLDELDGFEVNPLPSFESLKDKDLESMTADEARFFRVFKLFCTYKVAESLLPSLPMFGPKEISDGKATMVRFSQDPYAATSDLVKSKFNAYKARLVSAMDRLTSSSSAITSPVSLFVISSPASDPVTGT